MTRVTFEKGRSREPYPPATVSLLVKPSVPSRSVSTTRIEVLIAPAGAQVKTERSCHHHHGDRPGIARGGARWHEQTGGLDEDWRRTGRERCEPERRTFVAPSFGTRQACVGDRRAIEAGRHERESHLRARNAWRQPVRVVVYVVPRRPTDVTGRWPRPMRVGDESTRGLRPHLQPM